MLNSRWGAIFALGLVVGGVLTIVAMVWIIGLNYCPNEPCYYRQSADSSDENAGELMWQTPSPFRGTFSYESEPAYREQDPTRQEYYDLRAQERVAHATDWIAWVSFVSAIIGVLGLGALIYTLLLQRSANEIARNVGKVQARAYVHAELSDIQMRRVKNMDGSNLAFKATITIINSGNTPAYNLRTFYDIMECYSQGALRYNFEDEGQEHPNGVGFLPVGGRETRDLTRTWRVDQVESTLAYKEPYVRLLFAFRFTDEFGEDRDTPITSGTIQEYPEGKVSFLRDRLENGPKKDG